MSNWKDISLFCFSRKLSIFFIALTVSSSYWLSLQLGMLRLCKWELQDLKLSIQKHHICKTLVANENFGLNNSPEAGCDRDRNYFLTAFNHLKLKTKPTFLMLVLFSLWHLWCWKTSAMKICRVMVLHHTAVLHLQNRTTNTNVELEPHKNNCVVV